jgi:hypothetical protein
LEVVLLTNSVNNLESDNKARDPRKITESTQNSHHLKKKKSITPRTVLGSIHLSTEPLPEGVASKKLGT